MVSGEKTQTQRSLDTMKRKGMQKMDFSKDTELLNPRDKINYESVIFKTIQPISLPMNKNIDPLSTQSLIY